MLAHFTDYNNNNNDIAHVDSTHETVHAGGVAVFTHGYSLFALKTNFQKGAHVCKTSSVAKL